MFASKTEALRTRRLKLAASRDWSTVCHFGMTCLRTESFCFYSDRSQAQSSVSDVDILNFALNLEYLEAQLFGTGAMGALTAGHAVPVADLFVAQYAREIAAPPGAGGRL